MRTACLICLSFFVIVACLVIVWQHVSSLCASLSLLVRVIPVLVSDSPPCTRRAVQAQAVLSREEVNTTKIPCIEPPLSYIYALASPICELLRMSQSTFWPLRCRSLSTINAVDCRSTVCSPRALPRGDSTRSFMGRTARTKVIRASTPLFNPRGGTESPVHDDQSSTDNPLAGP